MLAFDNIIVQERKENNLIISVNEKLRLGTVILVNIGLWVPINDKLVMINDNSQLPLLLTWINFIPAWMSNYLHFDVWGEITYPFPNINGGIDK